MSINNGKGLTKIQSNMKNQENELKILEFISQSKNEISQREISRIVGMSLGMTNSIIKRFAEKGLISIKKVNNRNIQYVLTAEGIEEIGRRSWNYFKRTIKNVVVYRDAINEIISGAIDAGFDTFVLLGNSDLVFIVEHECYKQDVPFFHVVLLEDLPDIKNFLILAENNIETSEFQDFNVNYFLNDLVF